MKVEYFPTKNWFISETNMELTEDRVIEKFLSVKRLHG